ncbi:reductive dehalogenase [Chloroflexota bacterium]
MREKEDIPRILKNKEQLGPSPIEKLKRVDEPTTLITDNVQRFDTRQNGFEKAARGEYGEAVARERARPTKFPLQAALIDMIRQRFAPGVNGDVAPLQAPLTEDPEVLSRHIKSLGYFLRADIIGICLLPNYAAYSYDKDGNPIELNHKYAISIVIDQGYDTMDASSGSDWISSSQSFRGYTTSAFITSMMANYIRKLGYPARAHFNNAYQVVVPPLLVLSGIGEMSRIGGATINPFLGPRFKAAVVTTDLPLLPDKPIDFGLQKFCQVCGRCAEECPSRAISNGDKVMYNGYECWKLDVERCTKFRVTNQYGAGCGTCIKVCPWNKPGGRLHDTARWVAQHTPALDGMLVKMDSFMGFGKQRKEKQWWFDLEMVDGVIQVPKGKQNKS